MKRPLPNTYWVVEGRLLAGEFPGGTSPSESRKRIGKLLGAGIDSFIDLTEPGELPPYRDLLPPQVDYYNRPMPDHGVPDNDAAMHEVLAVIRRALDSDRAVYVHCRAGIGRTGMTIACHLGERGELDGEQSLARLNELWQQNARSARWPVVPETEDQEHFVRRFRREAVAIASSVTVPVPPEGLAPVPVPAAPSPSVRPATGATSARWRALGPLDRAERARGALLGLAIGDALAVSLQGAPSGTPVPTAFTGGGDDDLPPGAWTDETAMALCLADSLIESRGVDTRDQADRYLRWLRDGYRSATGTAAGVRAPLRRLLALAATRHSALTGSHDPRILDAEPLARCAPPALFFLDDLDAATEAAADAARVTHQAPVLVDACRLFAALIHTAVNGATVPQLLDHALTWQPVLKAEVNALAEGWVSPTVHTRRPQGAILRTLDAVVRAVIGAADFRSGLLALLALPEGRRGEADVAAAAYGQLAGAVFGERGLPAAWRERLVDAAGIAAVADALLPPTPVGAEAIPQQRGSR